MPVKQKIYFFPFRTLSYDGRRQYEITSVFGIHFYRADANPVYKNTWLPFVDLKKIDANQPKSHIPFVTKILIDREQSSKLRDLFFDEGYGFFITPNLIDNFFTIKCLLISAALGGGYWETQSGRIVLNKLKATYKVFFANYDFNVVESATAVDPSKDGIYVDSDSMLHYIDTARKYLGIDDEFISRIQKDVIELEPILGSNDKLKPCTLKFGQTKIDSYFKHIVHKFPARLTPTKYNLYPRINNANSTPEQIMKERRISSAVNQLYDHFLNKFRATTDPDVISGKSCFGHKIDDDMLVFLNNGHILVVNNNSKRILKSSDNVKVFVAYCLTTGNDVVIKVSNILGLDRLPSILHVTKLNGIIDGLGVTVAELNNMGYMSIVYPLMDCDLRQLLNKYSLSLEAKEKIFLTLLKALANLHNTSTLYANVVDAKMYHSDVKPDNVFVKLADTAKTVTELQPNDIEVYLADLDTSTLLTTSVYTVSYISPEMASEAAGGIRHRRFNRSSVFNNRRLSPFDPGEDCRWLEHNMLYGKSADIWSLGITLATIMLSQMGNEIRCPNFIRAAFYISSVASIYGEEEAVLNNFANLRQTTIDKELNNIKTILPQNRDGNRQRAMWDLIHSMLQVDPKKRPSIFDAANIFKANLDKVGERKLRQTSIKDYFPKKEMSFLQKLIAAVKNFASKIFCYIKNAFYYIYKFVRSILIKEPEIEEKTTKSTSNTKIVNLKQPTLLHWFEKKQNSEFTLSEHKDTSNSNKDSNGMQAESTSEKLRM